MESERADDDDDGSWALANKVRETRKRDDDSGFPSRELGVT